MTLYEITDVEGKVVKDAVTIKEASQFLNRNINGLYGAAAEGRLIGGKYRMRAIDQVISENRDEMLLIEYDMIRQQLLRTMRK